MKEEWRIFETKNPKLKDKFLCGFIDKKKTEARKCVRCKSVFSCKKSNTSALERHISSCTSTESEDVNQISIRKFLNSNTEKFTFHSQFVYLDNVSVTKVSSSPRFKKLFQKSGLAVPTYDDLNRTLNAKYFERIDLIKKLLEGKEKLVLALDKWTNNHHEKFIVVYVYQKGKSIFLGLINCDFSCGAKEMKKYTKELLAKFGIAKERLACVMSDCGLEMVRDDMLQLLDKWCGSKNAVVQAFNKRGKLYKRLAKEIDDNIENLQQTEHTYATPTSFKDFLQLERAVGPKEEQIRRTLRQIPATNSDIERAFSYAKYLKKDIQSRLKTENFTRNVFLKLTEECV